MPCDPNDNVLNPPNLGPPPAIPGFGIPFAPPAIPFPDLSLPSGIPEDLLDLLKRLLSNIPGGPLIPNLDNFAKDIIDALASLLNQLGPYLAIYRFFQALLNMIGCIMDIICCLTNPFCLIRAVRKLFKRCLPDFLNLFPWLALLAMIIALLLLLLALIQYLIDQILKLIQDIIDNILLLSRAVQVDATEDDLIAAAVKISQLLCLIEQLFSILVAFQAILSIIDALIRLAGRSFCGSSPNGDDTSCCGDEFCPPFIRVNPDGLFGSQGRLIYHREVDNEPLPAPFSSTVLPAIRLERWQFVDDADEEFAFKDIITPINGNIYWPEGRTYDKGTTPKKAPYILDMTLNVDPAIVFGHTDPVGGARDFVIKDIIVISRPNIGVQIYDDSFDSTDNSTGTLRLGGGLVFESDGVTPFNINGYQANLDSFVHFSPDFGAPTFEDGYEFLNVDYNLRYGHEVLVQETAITIGCIPEVEIERDIANLVVPNIEPVINLLLSPGGAGTNNGLPDVEGAFNCLTDALATFRQNVSIESAAAFQAQVSACLGDLKDQTLGAYNVAVAGGTNAFKSTATLEPEVQFVSLPIVVSVQLRDSTGTEISFNVPAESQELLANLLEGQVTFGQIGKFTYNGTVFVAEITSSKPGTGTLQISFNNNIFSQVLNQESDDVASVIEEVSIPYEFVGSVITAVDEPVQRRDESDTSNSDGN